jgi:hypothetical protein
MLRVLHGVQDAESENVRREYPARIPETSPMVCCILSVDSNVEVTPGEKGDVEDAM